MLSKEEIEDLICKEIIKISYKFILEDGKITMLPEEKYVDPTQKDSAVYKMFSKHYKGDRLNLTMGSIAVSHSYKTFKGRKNFNDFDYYFHLVDMDNKIEIQPRETITVNSNERITIKDEYGAFIFPRLTITDSGLFYVPSYIDPTWDGLMQATLYNFTDKRIELKLCEGISICRFYKISGKLDKDFKETFAAKNHHFGQNWDGIYEGSIPAIRRGKAPLPINQNWFYEIIEFLKLIYDKIKRNLSTALSFGIVAFIIWLYFEFSPFIKEFPSIKKSVSKLENEINRIPTSGILSFGVPAKTKSFTVEQNIERPFKNSETIWSEILNNKKNVEFFEIEMLNKENKVKLLIHVTLKDIYVTASYFKIKYIILD